MNSQAVQHLGSLPSSQGTQTLILRFRKSPRKIDCCEISFSPTGGSCSARINGHVLALSFLSPCDQSITKALVH